MSILPSLTDLFRMDGKVAIVTGAGHGLGLEVARRFAEAGASVILVDIDHDNAARAVAEIGSGHAIAADVSNRVAVDGVVAEVIDRHGHIDTLVNNAAIWPRAPFDVSDESMWLTTLRVNLLGTMHFCQAVTNTWLDTRPGRAIVNIASVAAFIPHDDPLAAYGASKAGVVNFSRTLARSLASRGIRVNALSPGGMDTQPPEAKGGRLGTQIPLGYRAHPDEVARGVLFLASELGSYVTGVNLVIDGGLSVRP